MQPFPITPKYLLCLQNVVALSPILVGSQGSGRIQLPQPCELRPSHPCGLGSCFSSVVPSALYQDTEYTECDAFGSHLRLMV